MAGHNFSRYMLDFWSAAFAPFHFLFTRFCRFLTQAIGRKTFASPPSPTSSPPSSPPASASPVYAFTPEPPPITITTAAAPQTTASLSSAHPLPSPSLHDQGSSHSLAGEELLDHTDASNLNSQDNQARSHHVADPSFQVSQQHQPVDMAKRRSGRGRGGAGSSVHGDHQPTNVMPVIPVTPAADTVQGWPASTSQSDTNAPSDTNFTPNHSNGPKFTSFKRGIDRARNHGSSPLQQRPFDSKKENVAPSKDNDTKSWTTPLDSPAPKTLATMDSTNEPQTPGTRSHSAVNFTGTSPTVNGISDAGSVASSEAEQLHVVANRLTLDDVPPSQQAAQKTLSEATAAAEASALPVPLVVAVPVPSESQSAQPGSQTSPAPTLPGLIEPTTDEERAEREYHLGFMRAALDMGDLALRTNETPVGCVLVYRGRVIARGMNATNITRNGTRHAEFMALSALLSRREASDVTITDINPDLDDASWGDVDPKDGHIYPYGQKLHPAPIVDRSIISECVLYVTVEPCVMCASLLRQLGIKKVYFGAVNDKFGGTGGVFRVHMNSKPVVIPKDRPYQQGYGPQDASLISKGRAIAIPRDDDEGDGGNVEPGYPVEGGYLRDDAVSLLRRFYVQENGRAPQPRKKEGRAARLYAALENQTRTANTSDLSDSTPETPVDAVPPMILGGKPDPTISVVCA